MTPEPASSKLLEWYRANRRVYPWRLTSEPYLIWLSEILLQQTRISVALPYFEKIKTRYPDVKALAQAPLQDFLSAWSGVGYYSRARNMHECARVIAEKHGGNFPTEFSELLSLPGIGSYTAAALSNVCFERLTQALDANIMRVLARLYNVRKPAESSDFKKTLHRRYSEFAAGAAPAEFFQAMMDLGENICLPAPLCNACPVSELCISRPTGKAKNLPLKKPKRKPERYSWYFLLLEKNGLIYIVRNTERPFLKDFWLFPDLLSKRKLKRSDVEKAFQERWNLKVDNLQLRAKAKHNVTYRNIDAYLFTANFSRRPSGEGRWLNEAQLKDVPTSSVLWKLLPKDSR